MITQELNQIFEDVFSIDKKQRILQLYKRRRRNIRPTTLSKSLVLKICEMFGVVKVNKRTSRKVAYLKMRSHLNQLLKDDIMVGGVNDNSPRVATMTIHTQILFVSYDYAGYSAKLKKLLYTKLAAYMETACLTEEDVSMFVALMQSVVSGMDFSDKSITNASDVASMISNQLQKDINHKLSEQSKTDVTTEIEQLLVKVTEAIDVMVNVLGMDWLRSDEQVLSEQELQEHLGKDTHESLNGARIIDKGSDENTEKQLHGNDEQVTHQRRTVTTYGGGGSFLVKLLNAIKCIRVSNVVAPEPPTFLKIHNTISRPSVSHVLVFIVQSKHKQKEPFCHPISVLNIFLGSEQCRELLQLNVKDIQELCVRLQIIDTMMHQDEYSKLNETANSPLAGACMNFDNSDGGPDEKDTVLRHVDPKYTTIYSSANAGFSMKGCFMINQLIVIIGNCSVDHLEDDDPKKAILKKYIDFLLIMLTTDGIIGRKCPTWFDAINEVRKFAISTTDKFLSTYRNNAVVIDYTMMELDKNSESTRMHYKTCMRVYVYEYYILCELDNLLNDLPNLVKLQLYKMTLIKANIDMLFETFNTSTNIETAYDIRRVVSEFYDETRRDFDLTMTDYYNEISRLKFTPGDLAFGAYDPSKTSTTAPLTATSDFLNVFFRYDPIRYPRGIPNAMIREIDDRVFSWINTILVLARIMEEVAKLMGKDFKVVFGLVFNYNNKTYFKCTRNTQRVINNGTNDKILLLAASRFFHIYRKFNDVDISFLQLVDKAYWSLNSVQQSNPLDSMYIATKKFGYVGSSLADDRSLHALTAVKNVNDEYVYNGWVRDFTHQLPCNRFTDYNIDPDNNQIGILHQMLNKRLAITRMVDCHARLLDDSGTFDESWKPYFDEGNLDAQFVIPKMFSQLNKFPEIHFYVYDQTLSYDSPPPVLSYDSPPPTVELPPRLLDVMKERIGTQEFYDKIVRAFDGSINDLMEKYKIMSVPDDYTLFESTLDDDDLVLQVKKLERSYKPRHQSYQVTENEGTYEIGITRECDVTKMVNFLSGKDDVKIENACFVTLIPTDSSMPVRVKLAYVSSSSGDNILPPPVVASQLFGTYEIKVIYSEIGKMIRTFPYDIVDYRPQVINNKYFNSYCDYLSKWKHGDVFNDEKLDEHIVITRNILQAIGLICKHQEEINFPDNFVTLARSHIEYNDKWQKFMFELHETGRSIHIDVSEDVTNKIKAIIKWRKKAQDLYNSIAGKDIAEEAKNCEILRQNIPVVDESYQYLNLMTTVIQTTIHEMLKSETYDKNQLPNQTTLTEFRYPKYDDDQIKTAIYNAFVNHSSSLQVQNFMRTVDYINVLRDIIDDIDGNTVRARVASVVQTKINETLDKHEANDSFNVQQARKMISQCKDKEDVVKLTSLIRIMKSILRRYHDDIGYLSKTLSAFIIIYSPVTIQNNVKKDALLFYKWNSVVVDDAKKKQYVRRLRALKEMAARHAEELHHSRLVYYDKPFLDDIEDESMPEDDKSIDKSIVAHIFNKNPLRTLSTVGNYISFADMQKYQHDKANKK